MQTIRVIIADDQVLVRAGITTTLAGYPQIKILAEAGNGDEIQEVFNQQHPDVLLLDLCMPGPHSKEILNFLKRSYSKVKVLLLTEGVEDETLIELLLGGAKGFLEKDECFDDLPRAILTVSMGGIWIDAKWFEFHLAKVYQQLKNSDETYKHRWLEILQLVDQGLTNNQIAEKLSISERMVRYHMGAILKQLHAGNRHEAVKIAIQKGWLGQDVKRTPGSYPTWNREHHNF